MRKRHPDIGCGSCGYGFVTKDYQQIHIGILARLSIGVGTKQNNTLRLELFRQMPTPIANLSHLNHAVKVSPQLTKVTTKSELMRTDILSFIFSGEE